MLWTSLHLSKHPFHVLPPLQFQIPIFWELGTPHGSELVLVQEGPRLLEQTDITDTLGMVW